jgi:hypothetical protein
VRSLLADYKIAMCDLTPYLPVDPRETAALRMDLQYLGYYVPWDPQEAYYYSVENVGFEANKVIVGTRLRVLPPSTAGFDHSEYVRVLAYSTATTEQRVRDDSSVAVCAAFTARQERTEGTYSKYNSLDDRIDGYV